jgi:hypothetical protein
LNELESGGIERKMSTATQSHMKVEELSAQRFGRKLAWHDDIFG